MSLKTWAWRDASEDDTRYPWAGGTGDCEIPEVDAGNERWVPCNSSVYSLTAKPSLQRTSIFCKEASINSNQWYSKPGLSSFSSSMQLLATSRYEGMCLSLACCCGWRCWALVLCPVAVSFVLESGLSVFTLSSYSSSLHFFDSVPYQNDDSGTSLIP